MIKYEYWVSPIDKKYYWHMIKGDKVLALGPEGLATKGDCLRAIEAVKSEAHQGLIHNLDKGAE